MLARDVGGHGPTKFLAHSSRSGKGASHHRTTGALKRRAHASKDDTFHNAMMRAAARRAFSSSPNAACVRAPWRSRKERVRGRPNARVCERITVSASLPRSNAGTHPRLARHTTFSHLLRVVRQRAHSPFRSIDPSIHPPIRAFIHSMEGERSGSHASRIKSSTRKCTSPLPSPL